MIFAAGTMVVPCLMAKTDWKSARAELAAAATQPLDSQRALLKRLKEEGAPWDTVDACRFAMAEAFNLWESGNLDEAGSVLVAAADAGAKTEEADALLLGWIEHCRGVEAFFRSEHLQAMRLCENAIRHLRNTSERRDLASALMSYADASSLLGLERSARDAWLEARELFAVEGDAIQAAMLDVTLMGLSWDTQAEQQLRNKAFFEAMDLFRREQNRDGIVLGTITLVNAALLPSADLLHALDEVEHIVEEKGDGIAEFTFAHLRLNLYFEQKNYEAAVVHGRHALALARAMGDRDYQRWVLVDLGWALLELGDPDQEAETRNLLLEGRQMNRELEDRFYQAYAELGLARMALEDGALDDALALGEAAVDGFSRDDYPKERSKALAILSRVVGERGDHERAHALMREAFELRVDHSDREFQRVLAEASAQYENELRNNSLRLARMERELAEKRLDQQAEELGLAEALRARDRRFRNLSVGSGAVAGTLALVLAGFILLRRKTLHRVERLNEDLRVEKEALAYEAKGHEEANSELLEANMQLKLLDEERKSLLGMTAHDMRNPVGAIQSSLELLEAELDRGNEADPAEIREFVTLASDASTLLLESIERILAAQEEQNLKSSLHLRAFDPRALIEQTVLLNEPAADRKDMRILLREMPAVEVEADGQALRTSFDNLLSNAIKYSFPGAEIGVSLAVEADGESVVLSVEDGGPGIAMEEMDRLFLPFASLSNRPTGGERSTGLGLASVQSAVEAMGGTVEAENRTDQTGARFKIRLLGRLI